MTDLEQLRADLAVLERYSVNMNQFSMACAELKSRIAELEAKADPWRGVKTILRSWRSLGSEPTRTEVARYVDHLTAENKRLAARVAELEISAKATPVSLKRADEIRVGDSILGGGEIRTISQVHATAEEVRVRLWGDGWGEWFEPYTLVAVVNGAVGEGETRPLKKGCDDGK